MSGSGCPAERGVRHLAVPFLVVVPAAEDVGPDGLPLAESCDERAAVLARQAADLEAMVRAEQVRAQQATAVLCEALAELREQLLALRAELVEPRPAGAGGAGRSDAKGVR